MVVTATISGNKGDGMVVNMHVRLSLKLCLFLICGRCFATALQEMRAM